MRYDPDTRHRRSIRLKGYDYTQPAPYFVTVCVQGREAIFGKIVGEEMQANDAGRMVGAAWDDLPRHYPGVQIDAFVVMPNHIHGIIVLTNPTDPARLSLPDVVHRFKSFTTAQYRRGVESNGWPPFAGRLWQRNYYEHVIRDEDEWNRIRDYIRTNPQGWALDSENPGVTRPGKPEAPW